MRIHTDILTVTDIYKAAARAGDAVRVDVTEHGSRSRARAFNVKLTGTSTRRPNPGQGGRYDADAYAATWDEWGMFLAELFRRDGALTIPNVYPGMGDFEYQTNARFNTLTPENQHGGSGHRWEFMGTARERECATCDAIQRF